jgi:hypothetical protein
MRLRDLRDMSAMASRSMVSASSCPATNMVGETGAM